MFWLSEILPSGLFEICKFISTLVVPVVSALFISYLSELYSKLPILDFSTSSFRLSISLFNCSYIIFFVYLLFKIIVIIVHLIYVKHVLIIMIINII